MLGELGSQLRCWRSVKIPLSISESPALREASINSAPDCGGPSLTIDGFPTPRFHFRRTAKTRSLDKYGEPTLGCWRPVDTVEVPPQMMAISELGGYLPRGSYLFPSDT